ncbi:hypothetical protein E4U13_001607 [Claviceps humidiphila]|uniref:Secreted protein n=1 Tax=Claviceps humidiphila TaxID=1294629 RepID=A0A9P7Q5G1_9HYPO|nr:hypothetical protein E4U13_001607 [Claviceps humidiphila]
MANIMSILIATLAVVSPVAQAGGCTPGRLYCGRGLQVYEYPGAQSLRLDSLYSCQSDGSLKEKKGCPFFCLYGGVGNNDYCSDFGL